MKQWETASEIRIANEPAEVHIVGDMNLDAHNGKWLSSSYHLSSLAKIVHDVCSLCNFHQLVHLPTRCQYNSISGQTNISCIDHVYVNSKFKCSKVKVTSFGNSDHDLISYIRFNKDPKDPARTIRKHSYREFDAEMFLADLKTIDWSYVYGCREVDHAVKIFTYLFRGVLDAHAPWKVYQQRHKFSPWITDETIRLRVK